MKRRSSNSTIKHSIGKKINTNWRSFFFQITEFLSSTSPIIKFRILIHHQITIYHQESPKKSNLKTILLPS